jgi:hypothetical protein
VTSEAITALAPRIGTRAACRAAGVAQASWYRRHRISPVPARRAPVPHRDRAQPRALAAAERQRAELCLAAADENSQLLDAAAARGTPARLVGP